MANPRVERGKMKGRERGKDEGRGKGGKRERGKGREGKMKEEERDYFWIFRESEKIKSILKGRGFYRTKRCWVRGMKGEEWNKVSEEWEMRVGWLVIKKQGHEWNTDRLARFGRRFKGYRFEEGKKMMFRFFRFGIERDVCSRRWLYWIR